jgi:hypothetical protein
MRRGWKKQTKTEDQGAAKGDTYACWPEAKQIAHHPVVAIFVEHESVRLSPPPFAQRRYGRGVNSVSCMRVAGFVFGTWEAQPGQLK